MKKLLALTGLIFLYQNLIGQTIYDSVFNDVILIKKTDVATDGSNFLIDLPIKSQKDPITIYNYDTGIPVELFYKQMIFLDHQDEIILINSNSPNTRLINDEKETSKLTLYHIKRDYPNNKIDSIQKEWFYTNIPIKINTVKPILKENEVKYFYEECYDVRDLNLANIEDRKNLKIIFNQIYGVDVFKDVYRKILGEKGEYCDYYTLNDLTNEQKIVFMRSPKSSVNLHLKDFNFSNKIILPKVIDITNMDKIN